MKGKRRIKKGGIIAIVICSLFALLFAVTAILNAFVPVKFLPAYTVRKQRLGEGEARVSIINVGFGDSALIELPDGKSVLIDSGDGANPNVSAILKCLNRGGIKEIDYLVCTSIHKEHCGGFAELLRHKKVKKAYIPYCKNKYINGDYRAFIDSLEKSGVPCETACAGEGFFNSQSNYFLTFLAPSSPQNANGEYALLNSDPTPTNIENASVVTWFSFGGAAFAFSSDSRAATLESIVKNYELSQKLEQPFCKLGEYEVRLEECKVATVAGHGGEDNACTKWYKALSPSYATVSVGLNYGRYPSITAVSGVNDYARISYTKYNGTLTFTVKDGKCELKKEKK